LTTVPNIHGIKKTEDSSDRNGNKIDFLPRQTQSFLFVV
jgi:hypothetical protein